MRHTQGDNIVKRYALTTQLRGTDIATVRRSHWTVHLLLLCAPGLSHVWTFVPSCAGLK